MNDDDDREIRLSMLEIGDLELAVVSFPKLDPKRISALTPAEADVVGLVLEGLSNVEIGERRGTSERTVANQLAAIYDKLGVNTRAELVAWLAASQFD